MKKIEVLFIPSMEFLALLHKYDETKNITAVWYDGHSLVTMIADTKFPFTKKSTAKDRDNIIAVLKKELNIENFKISYVLSIGHGITLIPTSDTTSTAHDHYDSWYRDK